MFKIRWKKPKDWKNSLRITTTTETTQNTTGDPPSAHTGGRGTLILQVTSRVVILVFRGSALQKRLRDREKESELDERDRKREKEEHEEIRQRLLAEGHPDPDAELQRVSLTYCTNSPTRVPDRYKRLKSGLLCRWRRRQNADDSPLWNWNLRRRWSRRRFIETETETVTVSGNGTGTVNVIVNGKREGQEDPWSRRLLDPLRSIRTTMWRKGRRRTTTTERTHKKPSRYSNPSCDQSVLLPQCPPPVGTRPLTRPVTNLPAELSFLVRTRLRSSLQRNIGPRSMSVSSWVSAEANVGHERIYYFSSTALFQNKLTLFLFLFSRGHQQSQPAQCRKEKETGHCGKCFQQVWWRGGRWAASQEETGSTGLWWWRQESGGGRGRVTRGQRQHQHRRETQAHKEPYWEDPHSQTRAVLLPSGLDYGWLGKKLGQFRFQALLFTWMLNV